MAHITTTELDQIARLGLDDLRACLSAEPPAGSQERAELTLKILRQGTSRMSGENNRIATALKVARAAGIAPDQQRILWQQILASDQALQNVPGPLAPAKSITSPEKGRRERQESTSVNDRSQAKT